MRKFVLAILLFFLPVILAVLIYSIYAVPRITGDLGHLDMILFDPGYAPLDTTLHPAARHSVIHCPAEASDTGGILVLGDSFSHSQRYFGAANYVNILAALDTCQVYNLDIDNQRNNPVQLMVDMLRFKSDVPRRLVLEVTERSLPYFFRQVTFTDPQPVTEVFSALPCPDTTTAVRHDLFDPIRKTQMCFKKHLGIETAVRRARLKQKFFTCRGDEDMLYFYEDDIRQQVTADVAREMRQTIVRLQELAVQKGVRLLLVVPSDKYALYRPWLVKDPYAGVQTSLDFFEDFEADYFISGRRLLRPELEKGAQDLYLCNDSHWGQRAASLVAHAINAKLR